MEHYWILTWDTSLPYPLQQAVCGLGGAVEFIEGENIDWRWDSSVVLQILYMLSLMVLVGLQIEAIAFKSLMLLYMIPNLWSPE